MFAPIKVVDGVWRGPEPKLIEDKLKLRDMGIKFILDLETGARIFDDGNILMERLDMKQYGIDLFNLPLSELQPPSSFDLLSAVNFIVDHPQVYVHCKAGVDRTGMVIAAYRMIVQKWAKSDAVAEMKTMGMHWWYYWWAWSL